MPKLAYAAELCRILRSSGTGEGKLDILRELIVKNPTATADDGYEALTKAPHRVTPDTLKKARQAIDTGGCDVFVQPEKIPLVEDQAVAFIAESVKNTAKAAIRAQGPKFDAAGVWAPKLPAETMPDGKSPSLPSLGRGGPELKPTEPPVPLAAETPGTSSGTETKPTDSKPGTSSGTETKPTDSKPGTSSGTETKPTDSKPEPKPETKK